MSIMDEKLLVVVDELKSGNVDVWFHYPYVGCHKTEIIEYLEQRVGKPIILEDGELSFSLMANVED